MLRKSGQIQKVVVIFNLCFWLTVGFRYFQVANWLPAGLVQNILVLGVLALVVNALYLVMKAYSWFKKAVKSKKSKGLDLFIVVSFLAQFLFTFQRLP
jgi:hypothetical protein